MATNYPTSLDNGTSLPYPSSTDDTNSPSLAGGQDNQNDALIAVETKLGTGSSTPSGTYALVSTGTGTSAWSLATPTSTIVGISDTQTLTNKTIDAANNTITNLSGSDLADNTITATQIANATITSTQIASGSISYANLISTIFSAQVTSYTNTGSAGGSGFYANIGGIKYCWGQTLFQNSAASFGSSDYYSINFPSGFFNTISSAAGSVYNTYGAAAQFVAPVNEPSTTSWSLYFMQSGTLSGAQLSASWYIVGT